MGTVELVAPVKLIVAAITANDSIFQETRACLSQHFDKIDFESDPYAFDHTDYYQKEMGDGLSRHFLSFANLITPEKIADIKLFCNDLEHQFSINNKRRVNLDPGYVTLAKLVLATTKNQAHRIYLQQSIYAEITLKFFNKSFRPLKWTYPDYQQPASIDAFNQIRQAYLTQLKKSESGNHNLSYTLTT